MAAEIDDTYAEAFRSLYAEVLVTARDRKWLDEARRCFEWFVGRNDLRQPVVDHATGGCRDGLQAEGINQNQGAESTLAWLHSLIALHIAAALKHQFIDRDGLLRRMWPGRA